MTVRKASPGFRLALDYGPLLVFFAFNFLGRGPVLARVVLATAAFMVAMVVAIGVSWWRTRHVSPMLLISGALVLVFGGLTVYFADPRFIQMKPTIVYALFAAVLGFGLATGRPVLEQLLGTAYPGLSALGWRRLTVNWTIFFAVLAVANEVARAALSYDAWVLFKFPGCTVATVLFAIANVPMLSRHGLTLGEEAATADQLPPE